MHLADHPAALERSELLAFAEARKIPVEATASKPYSIDRNLLHTSYEGGVLEDPDVEPPADMFQRTADARRAPDDPRDVAIGFEHGTPVSVDGKPLGPVALLTEPPGTRATAGHLSESIVPEGSNVRSMLTTG